MSSQLPTPSSSISSQLLTAPSSPDAQDSKPLYIKSEFTQEHVKILNERLSKLSPQKILEWAIISIPNLFQTTAFGLTGTVILDMISKISDELYEKKHQVPLIFIDTLYHFEETITLANAAASKYNAPMYVYKPYGCENATEFESMYGEKFWDADPSTYDYAIKVEPSRRSYEEFAVQGVITGRRRSQRGDRGAIPIAELDTTITPHQLKLNPLANWDFDQVWKYVQDNNVPYNALIDQGYKSIGDWHSTAPTKAGQDEREGRWSGKQKTECGLHKNYWEMKAAASLSWKRKLEKEDTVNLAHISKDLKTELYSEPTEIVELSASLTK